MSRLGNETFYQRYGKRAIDLCLSLILLILFWWVLAIVALLVRFKLGSPVLFRQPRPGKDEKIFNLYKFRSMTDERDENGNLLPDEMRLTKFGKGLDHSKRFVLIVGDSTDTVTKGSCRYCGSYNAWTSSCARMHSVDYRSYIKYECDKAMEADIDIVVLYNNTRVDRSKCPEAVRYHGNHVAMMYYRDGKYYWDYPAVKKALQ